MLDAQLSLVLELTGAGLVAVLQSGPAVDGRAVLLALAQRQGTQVVVAGAAHPDPPPLPHAWLLQVLDAATEVVADEPFGALRLPSLEAGFGTRGVRSVLVLPLPGGQVGEDVPAVALYLEHGQPQPWTQAPRALLAALATQIAASLALQRRVQALEQQLCTLQDEAAAREARLQGAVQAAEQSARDAAQEATRARSAFLAEMGHDIRTPMNGILGLSYLALRATTDPRQLDYLRKIQQSGQHLLGIINDILDLSRLHAGELGVERIDFSLDSLLENLLNLVGDAVAAKGLELVFDVDPDVPAALLGDPLRLGQILMNLIDNAMKVTEEGEIVVRVRVQERGEAEVLLQFLVQDSGVGMAPDQRARMVQALQEPTPQELRDGGGSRGLVIAAALARLMGGALGVHGTPGRGNAFWVRCRLGVAQQRKPTLALQAGLRGRRVLVVDDNANARQVLREMLAGMALAPVDVASGEAALEEARRGAQHGMAYEIVYLDWKMPGMDGLETARRLLAMALPGLRGIVMVTAYGQHELGAQVRAMGVCEIVTKPVSPSALFEATLRVLGASSAQEPLPLVADTAPQSALRGLRVLLAEDNELNQQIALELLREAGCETGLAVHGREAVQRVQQAAWDVVLMDVQMPVMDGIEAARAIHALPGMETLPIIAMTATITPAERERCRRAGMVDFVAKPVEPADLWRALQRWVALPRAAQPSGAAPAEDVLPTLLAPLEAPLPAVEGLNQAAGLRRAMGRQDLYLRLLRRFVDSHRHAARDIAVALGARDLDAAERLTHALRRVAVNIGAESLLQPVAALERGIVQRVRPAEAEALLDALARPLASLVAGLSGALAAAEDNQGMFAGQAAQIEVSGRQAGWRVHRQLVAHDAQAVQSLEQHRAQLRGLMGSDFAAFAASLHRRDFEAAAGLLGNALGMQ